jgi:hypothetical protein
MSPDENPLEIADLIRRAQAQGWVAERHDGMVLLRSPGASTIVAMRDEPGVAAANGVSRLTHGGFVPSASIRLPEHTVEVDSHPGVTRSEEDLLHVAGRLGDTPDATLPALSLDTTSGTIGATFQAPGGDVPEFVQNAAVAFAHALVLAGLKVPHDLGTVRVVDEVSRSDAAPPAPRPADRGTGRRAAG